MASVGNGELSSRRDEAVMFLLNSSCSAWCSGQRLSSWASKTTRKLHEMDDSSAEILGTSEKGHTRNEKTVIRLLIGRCFSSSKKNSCSYATRNDSRSESSYERTNERTNARTRAITNQLQERLNKLNKQRFVSYCNGIDVGVRLKERMVPSRKSFVRYHQQERPGGPVAK